MAAGEQEDNTTPEEEQDKADAPDVLPIGIARVRDEWLASGYTPTQAPQVEEEIEPVLFTEIDGGAGIGDYTLDLDAVRQQLALADEAIDRLIASGELDSILVKGPEGPPRRMVSASSLERFQVDSAIDPEAIKRAAKALADGTVTEAITALAAQIEELRGTQSRVLQQMKDMLLLEVRNLKEQDRDLTSFVYELAEEVRRLLERRR